MKILKGQNVLFTSTKQEDEMLESYLHSHFQLDTLDVFELMIAIEKVYDIKLIID